MCKTRGQKSSERKACYHAFYAALVMGTFGIYLQADLSALSVLVGAVCAPLMVYAGARTALKRAQGEEDVET